jgi:hypothetical protein
MMRLLSVIEPAALAETGPLPKQGDCRCALNAMQPSRIGNDSHGA